MDKNFTSIEAYKNEISQKPSAWSGHFYFALDLVQKINPNVVVDLGVDWGFSLFSFAYFNKGETYGIDWFEGDSHAGLRNTYDYCSALALSLQQRKNIKSLCLIKGDFSEVAKKWTKPIDILHIDGLHTYDAVKNDFNNWQPHIHSESVVLFHDIETFEGVAQFFYELDGLKLIRRGSCGLGLLTYSPQKYSLLHSMMF